MQKVAQALCNCEREVKIPQIELAFVKAQREKVGSAGSMQIGGSDIPESKRQEKSLQNKEKEAISQEKAENKRKAKEDEEEKMEQRAKDLWMMVMKVSVM